MLWTITLTFTALMILWLQWRYRNRKLIKMADKIPGPPPLPILGNALKFMVHNKELKILIKNLMNQYGEVLKFWLGMDLNIIVSNPDDLKLLLSSNKTSVKGEQYKYFKSYIGRGLLSGSGAVWRKHRKIATPNFGKQATGSYFHVFNMEADILLENLKEIRFGDEIDAYQYIVQSTSYSVCQTLLGLTRKETLELPHLQYIIDESPQIYTIIFERMTKWFMQIEPVFWLTKSYQVEKEFVSRTDELCSAVIKLRINKLADIDEDKLKLLDTEKDSFNNTELSVVDRFILSRELDATDLKYEIFTIFTASQEATAKLAASLLLMLAFHPQCQKKAYDEITTVLRNKNKPISEDDLKQMPYLEMIFKEVLRLFPTGVVLQRKINEDITISSCTLPAGSSLVIPLYHMHRDSRFWENPESFDPERFSTENMKKRNAYCYFPFSLGPMDCLGRFFGTSMIKIIVIRIIQEYYLTSTYKYSDLQVGFSISVTSSIGYPVILTPRK